MIDQKSAPAEEDVGHTDEPHEKPAMVKPNPKPAKKGKESKTNSGKRDNSKPVEKVWSNQVDCEDAETKMQERLAQVCAWAHTYIYILFAF